MKRSHPPLRLRKSPLLYVVAQIRIGSILRLDSYVPTIQDQLRKVGFPQFKPIQTQEIAFDAHGFPSVVGAHRYEFQDKSGQSGIVLAANSISFHATKYSTYEEFEAQFAQMLEIIDASLSVNLTERFGLRYIDYVEPHEGEDLSLYLTEPILGLRPEIIGVTNPFSIYQLQGHTTIGQLVLRFRQVLAGSPIMPLDLQPTTLTLRIEQNAARRAAVLDFDHFRDEKRDFVIADAIATIGDLHDAIDCAFRASVTENALGIWEATRVG